MTASARSIELAEAAVVAAADKLASDLLILDVSDQLVITDCFVLASAPNDRQVRAVVDAIEEKLLALNEHLQCLVGRNHERERLSRRDSQRERRGVRPFDLGVQIAKGGFRTAQLLVDQQLKLWCQAITTAAGRSSTLDSPLVGGGSTVAPMCAIALQFASNA